METGEKMVCCWEGSDDIHGTVNGAQRFDESPHCQVKSEIKTAFLQFLGCYCLTPLIQ